jgi:hypothetical protein
MPKSFTLFDQVPEVVAESMSPRALFFLELGKLVEAAQHYTSGAGYRVDWSTAELVTLTGMPAADDYQAGLTFRLTAMAVQIHVTERDVLRRRWYAVPDDLIGGWAVATVDRSTADIDVAGTDERVPVQMAWGEVTARHLADLHNAWLANEAGLDAAFMRRLIEFSQGAFGPAERTKGLLDHLRKELKEVEADPHDIDEWVDVVILGLDGAWRHGGRPQEILDRIVAKLAKNEARTWPDWRTASEDEAIEHDRTMDLDVAVTDTGGGLQMTEARKRFLRAAVAEAVAFDEDRLIDLGTVTEVELSTEPPAEATDAQLNFVSGSPIELEGELTEHGARLLKHFFGEGVADAD